MNPNMSVIEMLDSFIFVVKGSRVIDRKATDWSKAYYRAYWMGEKYVRDKVYTFSELKKYFSHRVVKSEWRPERRDPFKDWFMNPLRFTCQTPLDAMEFAAMAARGHFEPLINIDAIVKVGEARVKARATIPTPPPAWIRAA
jgi:hypothetical protein